MAAIKVLIVDDSALIRKILTEIIATDPRLQVVGAAVDPFEAREMIKQFAPDVLTLDIEMPKMDGIAFLKNLMRLRPMPVVMISTLTEAGAPKTLEALELGAVDFIAKPRQGGAEALSVYGRNIIEKLVVAAQSNVHGEPSAATPSPSITCSQPLKTGVLCAIGASTGGTEAIKEVLLTMPSNCPPIVIAQHIPEAFSSSYAQRLNNTCPMNVHEVLGTTKLEPGNAYLAPGDDHLLVKKDGSHYIGYLQKSDKVNRHRPSVDVLFESVAVHAGKRAVAAILTGMGADGAKGLLALKNAGAYTIAQDEATSVVWGMPKAAVDLDAAIAVKPLAKIAKLLMQQSFKP